MRENKNKASIRKKPKRAPKTKLRFKELLGKLSITELAAKMDVTYTQLYYYKQKGANPTLLALEELAAALSEMRNETISISDLIGEKPKATKISKQLTYFDDLKPNCKTMGLEALMGRIAAEINRSKIWCP